MAHSKTNLLTWGFSGKLGNLIVLRNVNGKIIMSNMPGRYKKAVGKQVETCNRFRMASRWAKSVLEDPEMLAAYRARAGNGLTAYNVAVSDFLKAPVVSEIDVSEYLGRSGDKITVTAKDDFKVLEVTVTISGRDGKEIEKGFCTPGASGIYWHYKAATDTGNTEGLTVRATVRDYPGNRAEMAVILKNEK